jgi:nucleotide-binding universal stress UspA family protein
MSVEKLMIKTILVPISGSDTDTRVFSTALSVARPLAAHLKFFHVRLSACEAAIRTRHVEHCVGPAINSALHALEQDQVERSETAVEQAEAFCAMEGISLRDSPSVAATVTAEIIEETDQAELRLLTHARHSDLLVLGRPAHEDLMPYYLIETLLLGSGRPILIAADSRPALSSGTIVVGWQETPAAARALTAALPLMKCAQRVVLVNVGEPHSATPRDLDRVAAQLSWHGVFAEVRHLTGTPKGASQVLLQSASDLNPEILVVGGYSHRPLQEMIFGGVTRALLAQAETPIFMMN